MGWWRANKDGGIASRGGDDNILWGDEPADLLTKLHRSFCAIVPGGTQAQWVQLVTTGLGPQQMRGHTAVVRAQIVAAYKRSLGRPPSDEELLRGARFNWEPCRSVGVAGFGADDVYRGRKLWDDAAFTPNIDIVARGMGYAAHYKGRWLANGQWHTEAEIAQRGLRVTLWADPGHASRFAQENPPAGAPKGVDGVGLGGYEVSFPPVMINSDGAAAAKRLRAELDVILRAMPYTEPGEGTDLRAALYRVLGHTGYELRIKHILNDVLLVAQAVRGGDVSIQRWLAHAGWAVWSAIPGMGTLHLQVQRLSPADRAIVAAGTESFMGLGGVTGRRGLDLAAGQPITVAVYGGIRGPAVFRRLAPPSPGARGRARGAYAIVLFRGQEEVVPLTAIHAAAPPPARRARRR